MKLDQAFHEMYNIHWRCDKGHILGRGLLTLRPMQCQVCQSPLVEAVMERKQ